MFVVSPSCGRTSRRRDDDGLREHVFGDGFVFTKNDSARPIHNNKQKINKTDTDDPPARRRSFPFHNDNVRFFVILV
jgi:hypothetical protein